MFYVNYSAADICLYPRKVEPPLRQEPSFRRRGSCGRLPRDLHRGGTGDGCLAAGNVSACAIPMAQRICAVSGAGNCTASVQGIRHICLRLRAALRAVAFDTRLRAQSFDDKICRARQKKNVFCRKSSVLLTSFRSLTTAFGDFSLLPLFVVFPHDPLRWARAGTLKGRRFACCGGCWLEVLPASCESPAGCALLCKLNNCSPASRAAEQIRGG